MGGKPRETHLHIQEYWTIYIHTSCIKIKNIHTLFQEQAVCRRGTKWKALSFG